MISFSSKGVSVLEKTKKYTDSQFLISDLLEKIAKKNQGFSSPEVLENSELLTKIDTFVRSHSQKQYLVILGIGGSALGGIALQKILARNTEKNIFFLDTLDPEIIEEVFQKISLFSTLFMVISKSGGTVESLSQYAFFKKKIEDEKREISRHFVFITGEEGFLREEGEKNNISLFDIPENVGGRFSVLTAVGLLPARFMGIDISSLLLGAKKMAENFFCPDKEKNLAFQFATIQYNALQKGITKNVMYAYSNKLFALSDWYRQLLAESTGKKFSQEGEMIFTGITPLSALGVTDHHSQNQLYMEGPFDTLLCFLEVEKFSSKIYVPEDGYTKTPLSFVQGKKFSEILEAEREAAKQSLTLCQRPWISISIPSLQENFLGQMFLFFEASVAFLGEMMNINAFDQPGVEQTKILTKKILQEKKREN